MTTSRKTSTLVLRLEPELHAQLRAASESSGLSISDIARLGIRLQLTSLQAAGAASGAVPAAQLPLLDRLETARQEASKMVQGLHSLAEFKDLTNWDDLQVDYWTAHRSGHTSEEEREVFQLVRDTVQTVRVKENAAAGVVLPPLHK